MKQISARIATRILRYYQRYFSPDKGVIGKLFVSRSVCTMYPSCSEYMILAIQKYGTGKGIAKGILRIGRCHPFQKKLVDFP